jgi:uncharacterized membrane protein
MNWLHVLASAAWAYMGYYFIWGTRAEMIRAVKLVYYLFQGIENFAAQHL